MKKQLSIFFSLVLLGFLIWSGCGKLPLPLPDILTGSIKIIAMDTLAIDSVHVVLDDAEMGHFQNPYVLDNVVVGTHKLFVQDKLGASSTDLIEVKKDEITSSTFILQTIGPYLGNTAPAFSTTDIQENQITSESLKGKVVLLAFFEHT